MTVRVRYKVWVEDGKTLIGKGLCALLGEIDRSGSISKAAGRLNMSYRHAWGIIRKAEERIGFPLLQREVGGQSGGGAELTDRALELVRKYRLFDREVHKAIENLYCEIFDGRYETAEN